MKITIRFRIWLGVVNSGPFIFLYSLAVFIASRYALDSYRYDKLEGSFIFAFVHREMLVTHEFYRLDDMNYLTFKAMDFALLVPVAYLLLRLAVFIIAPDMEFRVQSRVIQSMRSRSKGSRDPFGIAMLTLVPLVCTFMFTLNYFFKWGGGVGELIGRHLLIFVIFQISMFASSAYFFSVGILRLVSLIFSKLFVHLKKAGTPFD